MASRFAVGLVLPSLLAIVILTAVAKEFVPDLRRVVNVWNIAVLAIGIACFVAYMIGVFSAVQPLIDSLSS